MKGAVKLSKLLRAVLPKNADHPAPAAQQQLLQALWRRHAKEAAPSRVMLFQSGRVAVFTDSAACAGIIRHRRESLLRELNAEGLRATEISVTVQLQPPGAE